MATFLVMDAKDSYKKIKKDKQTSRINKKNETVL